MSVFIGYPSFMAYQMMKGKKGNNDGFPSIPGMIARYSALGLTNEQMATNPVWVDKTGNDHDLQMKNFAWGGMSGVGGYNQNFNQWGYGNLSTATQTHTSYKIELSVPSTLRTANIYSNAYSTGKEGDIYDFTLNIVGLKDGASLRITKGVASGVIEMIEKDGIYKIYQPIEAGWDQSRIYIFISNPNLIDLNITIEQLPLYPGALVFDGVDDYGVCKNFPILTKEKGYTVVALRQYLVDKSTAYLTANGDSISNTSFILEGNNYRDTWNFGKPTAIQSSRILATQTSKQYDGVKLNIGTNTEGSNLLQVGKWRKSYSNVAIWELVFLDHDATEEELTKIKDYFVKTYPWLFPDQAWTVTGKTNEDEDRATIANITGNGNDLVLSNFGFAEGSGYNEEGEYAGYLVTEGVDDSGRAVGLTISKDFTLVGEWILFSKTSVNAGLSIHPQIHIFNRPEAIQIVFRTAGKTLPVKSLKAICSDGRCYDENWSELKINVGEFTDNKGVLFVASNGTNYAQIAFKNLGIYNNQILSKDDCIKAYNYLQTLKAK